jgi:hypothetical protein
MLLDLPTAIGVLQNAVEKADFRPVSVGADGVVIDVPRSLRKRRRAATLPAAVTDRGRRTEVCWLVAGPDDRRHAYLGLLGDTSGTVRYLITGSGRLPSTPA